MNEDNKKTTAGKKQSVGPCAPGQLHNQASASDFKRVLGSKKACCCCHRRLHALTRVLQPLKMPPHEYKAFFWVPFCKKTKKGKGLSDASVFTQFKYSLPSGRSMEGVEAPQTSLPLRGTLLSGFKARGGEAC